MQLPTLIIDADPAIYRAGFASQSTVYEYVYETKAGELRQKIWDDGRKAQAFFRRYPDLKVLNKEAHITAAPESFARQATSTVMKRTVDAVVKRWGLDDVNDLNIEVILSGPGNFRDDIAKINPYKHNRKGKPVPIHYQLCRDHMVKHWGAVIISGWEADDECSIRAARCRADGVQYCIATIDKDLDQIPGLHYGYSKHVFYDVNASDAETFFWEQCISGDSTDGIQGCYKIGAGKAAKLVAQWTEEWDRECSPEDPTDASLEDWLWQAIVNEFALAMDKYQDKYPEDMTPEEAALETARLVKMLDFEYQLWCPPGIPDESLA